MTNREALQIVYDRNGALTPAIVVEEARGRTDEAAQFLHKRLTWDDDDAAEKFRLIEAARLIRKARIVFAPTPNSTLREVRAFVSVPTERGRSYEPIESAVQNDIQRRLMLQEAERMWRDLWARHAHLAEFVEMVLRDVNGGEEAA